VKVPRLLLPLLAAGCAVGAAATYLVALRSEWGLVHDAALHRHASGQGSLTVRAAGQRALRTIDAASLGAAVVALAVVALARRQVERAAVAVALVVLSVGSVERVKHGLPHIRHGLPAGRPPTWPSGHASVAVALGLGLVLAAPPLLRATVAVAGAAYAAGIGLSVVVLGWHYPSDVIGSMFICGFWASLGAAVLRLPRRAAGISAAGLAAALMAVAAALFAAAAIAERHPGALAVARASRSVVAAGLLFGLLSVALFAAFTAVVGERER
jgi:membrane-associated phospholipid phosphatase